MAAIVVLKNPLQPHTREIYPVEPGTLVIDWLQAEYPDGFGMPIKFYMNQVEQELDDLDLPVGEDDVAVIAVMPADPSGGILTSIAINLAIAAVLAAASFALNYFFAPPTQRSGKKGEPSTIYSVSSEQNAARLGEPIPVVYGVVKTTPDYVAQPYTYYDWRQLDYNERYSGIQYLYLLLCVGQGNIDVPSIYLGDTEAGALPDDVTWRVFKPADHQKTPGVIYSAFGIYENVVTSTEVGNQEFIESGDNAGYFMCCKPGTIGTMFQIDIVFPSGAYDIDTGSNAGDTVGRTTQFTVYWVEVNDSGQSIGSENSALITCSTKGQTAVTGGDLNSYYTPTEGPRNKTIISSPLRRSYRFNMPRAARWAVRIVRNSAAPNAKNGVDRFIWTSLKFLATIPTPKVYGDVTLLAVRVKASQGVGVDAAVRIGCNAVRRVQPSYGGAEGQSQLGVDAFADVYTNAVYGAGRPRAELDTATLTAFRTKWSSYYFNYVFRERITVWDALRTITTPFGAEPLPVGSVMSIVADQVKTRTAIFTDANIIAGSMTISYTFDNETDPYYVEIEYADPVDFKPVYAQYPAGDGVIPQRYALPGVTNATHAAQYARYLWNKNLYQRKKITFDTELEGLLLLPGDRIGVAHNAVKWGDGGQILAVGGSNNRTLTVDHDLNWTGGSKQIILRATDGSISSALSCSRGMKDNIVVLSANPPFTINVDGTYDFTTFAFGSSSNLVRDFVVTAIRPSSENVVTVEAISYATGSYAGAMSYMLS